MKFTNHPQPKFDFYDIVGCNAKAGCQNFMYNLLSQTWGNMRNIQGNILEGFKHSKEGRALMKLTKYEYERRGVPILVIGNNVIINGPMESCLS